MAEAFFVDQTVMHDIDDDDMDLPDSIGQEIWRDYVNNLGPSAEVTLQIPEIEDFTLDDQMADLFEPDEEDPVLDGLLIEEFKAGESDVPYEWRYWEHTPDTLPEVDESNAPPMPSGWVDPDTDELVP